MYKPINKICLSVSIWTTSTIILITLFIGMLSFIQNIIQLRHSDEKRLNIIAPLLINSVSGNIVLDDDRSILAIQTYYIEKYNLKRILISKTKLSCSKNTFSLKSEACWTGDIPDIKPKHYLLISTMIKSPFEILPLFFLCIFFPLALLGILIPLIIKNKLKNSIVDPITTLANNPEKWKLGNKNVAKEVVDVYHKLIHFINERDSQIRITEKLTIDASLGKMATQLAHDIRSPLVALDVAIHHLENIPEENRILIRNATNRIRDIANNLLLQNKKTKPGSRSELTIEPIADLILSVISEKRLQYNNTQLSIITDITPLSFSCFVLLPKIEFKRILSNLLDNAADAVGKNSGIINVQLNSSETDVILIIKDNGSGMSDETLEQVKSGVYKSKKENGNGLGLSHAINSIKELWNRELIISSSMSVGTTIQITMPKSLTPQWFAADILVTPQESVVILDDDISIHNVWTSKFKDILPRIQLHNFYNPSNFTEWVSANDSKNILYLIDFELIGCHKTGLDLIEELNLTNNTFLVTSHYEEKEIRERCEKLGIKIIPKSYAPYLALRL